MKYLAICFLSLAAFLTAGTAPSVSAEINATISSPADVSAPFGAGSLSAPRDDNNSDRALAGVLAAALVALQLRRRQKSLRMPRQFS